MGFLNKLSHGWNAFKYGESKETLSNDIGPSTSYPSHKGLSARYSDASIARTVFNRIATDVSMVDLLHVIIDKETQTQKNHESGLHNCLTVEANIDQSNVQFVHDLVFSMFDEGVVAVVPIDTTTNPSITGAYDIKTLRVGKIIQWYPQKVKVQLYNDNTGKLQDITLDKKFVAIIENPFYSVVNDNNATLKRLIKALNLADKIDDNIAKNKLDLIIQFPQTIKSTLKQKEANKRRAELEKQLSTGEYGVAWIDGTDKVIQLNRPISTGLDEKVKMLREEFYNQMGLTQNVFNGTASEIELRIYYTRTIDPILTSIIKEFNRKFLTKTARSQGHTLTFHRNFFKLVPIEQLADIADKFSRNELLTANEMRAIIGYGPSDNPRADELRNPNIADVNQEGLMDVGAPPMDPNEIQNEE